MQPNFAPWVQRCQSFLGTDIISDFTYLLQAQLVSLNSWSVLQNPHPLTTPVPASAWSPHCPLSVVCLLLCLVFCMSVWQVSPPSSPYTLPHTPFVFICRHQQGSPRCPGQVLSSFPVSHPPDIDTCSSSGNRLFINTDSTGHCVHLLHEATGCWHFTDSMHVVTPEKSFLGWQRLLPVKFSWALWKVPSQQALALSPWAWI